MYTTCCFCHAALGRNETLEAFPVGRRLAYDAAKGRLWVVCRGCERWNLTPLEERWEAIDDAERRFRATPLRMSTDHVGLARVGDGLELVRIGAPLRPELAAWRYGDQFGRRRRRAVLTGGALGAVIFAASSAPLLAPAVGIGIVSLGFAGPALNLLNTAYRVWTGRRDVRVETGEGPPLHIRARDLGRAQLLADGGEGWTFRLAGVRPPAERAGAGRERVTLTGEAARRAAAALLPRVNAEGAGRQAVRDAVRRLEATPDPARLFAEVAAEGERRRRASTWATDDATAIGALRAPVRLALEMAAHEELERRAFEGELHVLEAAWRQAEEIAAIADDLLLPPGVRAGIERLRTRPGVASRAEARDARRA